jgi:toxin CcdB
MVMAQFDVYRNSDPATNEVYPFFVDVQNNLLASLKSRVVIPLISFAHQDNLIPANLCPRFEIQSQIYILMTQLISSVTTQSLDQFECSLSDFRDDFVAATDCLITGV